MNDVTKKPRRVLTYGTAAPYIRVPVTQLDDIQDLLRLHGVPFTVDELVISFNGGPAIAVVDLGRNGDAKVVQAILDKIA